MCANSVCSGLCMPSRYVFLLSLMGSEWQLMADGQIACVLVFFLWLLGHLKSQNQHPHTPIHFSANHHLSVTDLIMFPSFVLEIYKNVVSFPPLGIFFSNDQIDRKPSWNIQRVQIIFCCLALNLRKRHNGRFLFLSWNSKCAPLLP